jgi:uncharacterized coiled-coil DUF342 family protein
LREGEHRATLTARIDELSHSLQTAQSSID